MNVLSCFDGISCGQLALSRSGLQVDQYFSSEIHGKAIAVTQDNFPKTIQMGDIRTLNLENLPNIDLMLAGFPCQSFSGGGKQKGFDDDRGQLFFNLIDIFLAVQPKYFLFENVKMKRHYQDAISAEIGVEPILINSRLVSAQNRERLYWTNIPFIGLPTDKNVSWNDVRDDGYFASAMRGRRVDPEGCRSDYDMSIPIVQYIESRADTKTNCLSTISKDNVASVERYIRNPAKDIEWRYFSIREMELLQTLPVGYTRSVSDAQARSLIGNGWTIDIIVHILSGIQIKNTIKMKSETELREAIKSLEALIEKLGYVKSNTHEYELLLAYTNRKNSLLWVLSNEPTRALYRTFQDCINKIYRPLYD